MSPTQLEFFRQRLWQSRADLRRELEAIPPIGQDQATHEGDQTDHASADTDREFDTINRARIQNLLNQIERAFVRLEGGTYGYCEVTGEPIGLKRLMAQPATPLSLAAQEQRERRAS
jgi:DnaK suppressor protein